MIEYSWREKRYHEHKRKMGVSFKGYCNLRIYKKVRKMDNQKS